MSPDVDGITNSHAAILKFRRGRHYYRVLDRKCLWKDCDCDGSSVVAIDIQPGTDEAAGANGIDEAYARCLVSAGCFVLSSLSACKLTTKARSLLSVF